MRQMKLELWTRVNLLSGITSFVRSKCGFRQAAHGSSSLNHFTAGSISQEKRKINDKVRDRFITFVLGGPGSGKGTQCMKIVETFGLTHLSAGDLLRKEISSNTENGEIILDLIKEGKIVPSEVTVKLILQAMESSSNDKFLIDGFPRSEDNRIAFEHLVGAEPDVVLFFDCPEDEMVKRVLSRNQGRVDDNIDTIRKRLEFFRVLNVPVLNHYSENGKLYRVNAVGNEDEIFESVRPLFTGHALCRASPPLPITC